MILLLALTVKSGSAQVEVKPIEGSFINLAYQDVRNKYTNDINVDYTSPALWQTKVDEMAAMGVKYLIFMAVANDEKAYYPSNFMPHNYPDGAPSPVDVILDAAARNGMHVFMSTGWAKNQDDNLQDPTIKRLQLKIMTELAGLYKDHPAMYGWYLPVEDCLCPLFSQHAVDAVNALTDKARKLTPGKKILISPYGIVDSAFDDPAYEQQLAKLKVDIIAYQDEIGCVREACPLIRLRQNWQRLSDIHSRLGIEMWANCESFAWQGNTNDRTSALIPAAYERVLAQQTAASAAGAKHIVSFIVQGLFNKPGSPYQLGQPGLSDQAYNDYMAWRAGDKKWKLLEATYLGTLANNAGENASATINGKPASNLLDNRTGQEIASDEAWTMLAAGFHEIVIDLNQTTAINDVMVRMLNYHTGGIETPEKMFIFSSMDGKSYQLLSIQNINSWPNNRHDSWIETTLFDNLNTNARYVKVAFTSEYPTCIDEIFINPTK